MTTYRRGAASPSAARELPLLLGRAGDQPETLILVSVPDGSGVVHLRRWTADDWSAPPRAIAERSAAFMEWLEEQSRAGRSMNQSLYALRMWLGGVDAADGGTHT